MSNNRNSNVDRISRKYLILFFIIFSSGILATGYYVYKNYYKDIEKKVEDELISVSTLKVQEIVHWRNERMRNLRIIQNEVFGNRVKRTLENPDKPEIQNELLNWFIQFSEIYGYDRICLHDMDGIERMYTSKSDIEMPHPLKTYYSKIFDKKEIVFDDFYFDQKQKRIYLPLLVGMLDFKDNMKPLGTIICRIDPEEYLYPILDKWPVPRKTAKMHLVKKDGNEVRFLNQISERHNFRTGFSLADEKNKHLPAAKAVSGYTGIYESSDYKNDPVLSYIQSVPGTDWKLVVKIDKNEAFKPVKGILLGVSSVVFLLVILLGIGVVYIIRYQRYSYYKEIAKKSKELQKSENEVRKLNRTLEQKVAERTKDLEMSNKELESFAYSVSHDLRAPLRHILGFAGILRDEYLTDNKEQNSNLQKIIDSAGEMAGLIDDLLNYSRTGRREMLRKPVSIDEMVKQLQKRFINEFNERKIEWNIKKLPKVYCDENLLRSVWQNLLENALKFTKNKDKTLIEIGCAEKNNEYEFFIKDNGAGFEMSFSDKLFGVFQRLHSRSEFEGTGIGLANVRRIIERHGGKIRGESEGEGKGACFYFTLPKTAEGKK